jgi:uncharacterized protein DUF1638
MRLHLIGCSMLIRELSDAIVHSPHTVDARYLPTGLHDIAGKGMRDQIQHAVDVADFAPYDAILLGYALCGNGVVGLQARTTQLVIARAHDCITLLMGSRARYRAYFEANPGVYFRSTGWVQRAAEMEEQLSGLGFRARKEDLIAKYGEEAGQYLWDEFTRYRRNYRKLTYIRTACDRADDCRDQARAEAQEKNWAFEEIQGDNSLFRRLLSGDWNDDFLIVPPEHQIAAAYNEDIVAAAVSAEPY